jgi:protein required for attachment to host cells
MASPDMHNKTHDMVSDRGGRSFESATTGRHGIEAKTDPHDLAKERFVQSIAEDLNKSHAGGAFDVLVLAVTRAQVHTLETSLNATTRACVAAVVAKDLVKTPNHEIWPRLTEDGIMPPAQRKGG